MTSQKFEKALRRQAQPVPPIWMMRQAGRYHSHYRALRKSYGFMELCKNPKLAAKTALGPIEDFDFDVSILFSDLLFPLEALGFGLRYDPAPVLDWHLGTLDDFKKLKPLDQAVECLRFQGEALRETRRQLPEDKSLIGFVGSPWTLFVYAVCGSHKGNLLPAKKKIDLFPAFCETIGPLIEENIKIQLEGGAEVVMVFDTAAGELSSGDFKNFLELPLINFSKKFKGSLAYYSKNTLTAHLEGLWLKSDFCGFSYDHRWNLARCFPKHGGFVQGNFDQNFLCLEEKSFEASLYAYLKSFQKLNPSRRAGWVCSPGHGVLPQTPETNVKNFVKIVRESF